MNNEKVMMKSQAVMKQFYTSTLITKHLLKKKHSALRRKILQGNKMNNYTVLGVDYIIYLLIIFFKFTSEVFYEILYQHLKIHRNSEIIYLKLLTESYN